MARYISLQFAFSILVFTDFHLKSSMLCSFSGFTCIILYSLLDSFFIPLQYITTIMSAAVANPSPKSMTRPKVWSEEVEEAYRFQLAGYRDEREYKALKKCDDVSIYNFVFHSCTVVVVI